MPHISKGGKYIFGWSRIKETGEILIPAEAVQEYQLEPVEKVILISGSKTSGGFVVARKSLVEQSEISDVLTKNPALAEYQIEAGQAIHFKGRLYCWASLCDDGVLSLPAHTLKTFDIKPDDYLLSIRGSNIAFVMGVKGPIIVKARQHPEIKVFE